MMTKYVVVGGGIAGVTCAETVSLFYTYSIAVDFLSSQQYWAVLGFKV